MKEQPCKSTIALVLLVLSLLLGCKQQGGQEVADLEPELPKIPNEVLDSLMWLRDQNPDIKDQWDWAYDVCDALQVYDSDSLDTLTRELEESYSPYFSCISTSDMTIGADLFAATARFRMLIAYQALAEKVADTPLDSIVNAYIEDYVRWEKLTCEYDDYYNDYGGMRLAMIDYYYRCLADFRTKLLRQELACFSGSQGSPKPSDAKVDIHWDKQHKAIRRWYDYRLAMAEKLQQTAPSQAQCIRSLSRQAVQWYMDFTIDYETSTQVPED